MLRRNQDSLLILPDHVQASVSEPLVTHLLEGSDEREARERRWPGEPGALHRILGDVARHAGRVRARETARGPGSDAANMQAALNGLATIAPNTVTVTPNGTGAYLIQFNGLLEVVDGLGHRARVDTCNRTGGYD